MGANVNACCQKDLSRKKMKFEDFPIDKKKLNRPAKNLESFMDLGNDFEVDESISK